MSVTEQFEHDDLVSRVMSHPGKVMRVGMVTHELLNELRELQLDRASRARIMSTYEASVRELCEALGPDALEEFRRLVTVFGEARAPSDAELRVAEAQLLGWLDGLVHGLRSSVVLQALASEPLESERTSVATQPEQSDLKPGSARL
jgi:hypothetical protein